MKIDIYQSKNLLVTHAKDVEEILRRAVRDALLEHKRAGNYIVSWEDGEMVFIEADDIPIYEERE